MASSPMTHGSANDGFPRRLSKSDRRSAAPLDGLWPAVGAAAAGQRTGVPWKKPRVAGAAARRLRRHARGLDRDMGRKYVVSYEATRQKVL